MKARLSLGVAVVVLLLAAPAFAQNHQLLQGTQIRMTLQTGLSTSVARDGDPFTATVTEPVMLGNLVVLPAGARVNGTIANINRPKHFGLFRGQASMNLTFHSVEIDHREYPVQMSLLALTEVTGHGAGAGRRDVKIDEGTVVQERRDVKGTVVALALGMGGGSAVGAIFSNVLRGFIIGAVGSAVYVVAKKGKEVELPAQTGLLVRMDNTVEVPPLSAAMLSSIQAQ
ncbi:MAG TPA: hypothetical protein VKG84_01385 [Candidatus Acidoferrales bacterium]|nr:hypothetical protein [Candidatus Acidoferrales bacterium]